MRILLVTPLYPPDISEPAPYVKELARRLSLHHSVTVLAFNHIPEESSGVKTIPVEKSDILPIRLFRFMRTLMQSARTIDVLYLHNGPSVELPILLFSFFTRIPIYIRLGDEVALAHTAKHSLRMRLLRHTISRTQGVVVHTQTSAPSTLFVKDIPPERIHNLERPLPRPEILPFVPYPTEAMGAYETSWGRHVAELTYILRL